MTEEGAIPAANIEDVDMESVAQRDPAAAQEIAELATLLGQGEETEEQFRRLCQVLYELDEKAEAEYLLRRNLEEGDENHKLYLQLFGTLKIDELRAAINAFEAQFEAKLEFIEKLGFLDETYRCSKLTLFEGPCEVRFDYAEKNVITADACSDGDDYLILHWKIKLWEIAMELD